MGGVCVFFNVVILSSERGRKGSGSSQRYADWGQMQGYAVHSDRGRHCAAIGAGRGGREATAIIV